MRFECQPGCTKCCEQPGFVYLTEEDLVRAAGFLGMTAPDFEAQYAVRQGKTLRLRKPARPGNQCPFLLSTGCSIHPAKPTQCRLFPFWPEIVKDRQARAEVKEFCPGMGKGELIQINEARAIAREMNTAFPDWNS